MHADWEVRSFRKTLDSGETSGTASGAWTREEVRRKNCELRDGRHEPTTASIRASGKYGQVDRTWRCDRLNLTEERMSNPSKVRICAGGGWQQPSYRDSEWRSAQNCGRVHRIYCYPGSGVDMLSSGFDGCEERPCRVAGIVN